MADGNTLFEIDRELDTLLDLIASVATLLGLIGTIYGMIKAIEDRRNLKNGKR